MHFIYVRLAVYNRLYFSPTQKRNLQCVKKYDKIYINLAIDNANNEFFPTQYSRDTRSGSPLGETSRK